MNGFVAISMIGTFGGQDTGPLPDNLRVTDTSAFRITSTGAFRAVAFVSAFLAVLIGM